MRWFVNPIRSSNIFDPRQITVIGKIESQVKTRDNRTRESTTMDGGESGIRTRGTSLPTRFPVVPVRPLRHLSVIGPSNFRPSERPRLTVGNDDWATKVDYRQSGFRSHGRVVPTTVFEFLALSLPPFYNVRFYPVSTSQRRG